MHEYQSVSKFLERFNYHDVASLRHPGFNSAMIGVSTDNRAVYDYTKILEILRTDGMSDDQAVEFIDHIIIRGNNGTVSDPIIFHPLDY